MTDLPRVFVEVGPVATKVHIRWPDQADDPATTVLHGPAYGADHLGYTTTIPADAVELGPLPAPLPLQRGPRTETR